MAQKSYFFNSAPGDRRTYQAADFARYFGSVLTSGIMPNPETGDIAALTPGEYGLNTRMYANLALGLQVVMGNAIIRGYRYELDSPHDIEFRPQSSGDVGYDRIDRIVLRLDLSNHKRSIELAVVEGNTAIDPVPPALTRNYNVYELSLARVRVRAGYSFIDESDVVDERADETVCGFANSLITVPTSVFQQQFDAWFENYQTSADEDFTNWTEYQKLDVATWVNQFKDEVMDANDEYQTWINTLKASTSADTIAWQNSRKAQFDTWQNVEQRDFNAWVDGLKDNLGEAVAEDIKLEVEAARVDGETGEVFSNVPQRLDEQHKSMDSKVAQTFDINRQNGVAKINDVRPTIFFVDDDTHKKAHEIIFNEFVVGRGIPWLFAAISGRIGVHPDYMTIEQFNEVKNHPLTKIANHTNGHPYLATLTESQIEEEIRLCDEFLRKHGVFTRCFVPPFGSVNATVRKVAKRYADTVLRTAQIVDPTNVNCQNGDFLDTGFVRRIDFSNTLDDLKAAVDRTVATNGLLIIATHANYPQDQTQVQNFITSKMHEFIDYCQSTTIDITDYDTAYARFKNVVEYLENDILKVGVSAAGKTIGMGTRHIATKINANTAWSADDYPLNSETITVYDINQASANGYPFAGTLITTVGQTETYVTQELRRIRTNQFVTRTWHDGTKTWTEFKALNAINITTNKVYANDAFSVGNYPLNTITKTSYDTSQATQYGYPFACEVKTEVGINASYVKQFIYAIRTNIVMCRTWDDQTQTWTALREIVLVDKTPVTFGANYPDYATGTNNRRTVTHNSVVVGDSVIMQPHIDNPLPLGVFVQATITADRQITFDIFNMSQSTYNLSNTKWVVTIIKSGG